ERRVQARLAPLSRISQGNHRVQSEQSQGSARDGNLGFPHQGRGRGPAPVPPLASGRPRVLHLYRRFKPDFTGDGIYYEQLIPLLVASGSQHAVLVYETAAPDGPVWLNNRAVVYLQAGDYGPLKLARWIFAHRSE